MGIALFPREDGKHGAPPVLCRSGKMREGEALIVGHGADKEELVVFPRGEVCVSVAPLNESTEDTAEYGAIDGFADVSTEFFA